MATLIAARRPDYLGDSSDEEIVVIAREDPIAMDYILAKYQRLVRRRMRGYFLSGADADDLFQEGMIGLYKAVRDFKIEKLSSFSVFAEVCVTRQIISAIKTATRRKHEYLNRSLSIDYQVAPDDDRSLLDTLVATDAVDPSFEFETKAMSEGLRERIFRDLSPLEAQVLSCYLRKHSYTDISAELKRGMKCIDNALQRAKRKIGIAIEESHAS